jgi:C4-dicarboxylate-specific signal transduction histidine kinase
VATTGVLVYSTTFVGLNVLLSALVWQLRHTHRSRSLLLIQVAFAIHAGAYLNRLYQYAMTGLPEYLDIFSFSWVSNLVTLSTILTIVLICFGYWGFTLEKSNSEKSHAQRGQRQAEAESETMRSLVKERDQLLMLNARVSSLSSLSSFSAMLVHDISQPLQALELGLYDLQNQVTPLQATAQLQPRIDSLMLLSGKASEMVSSLRRLMIRGQDQMDAINLLASVQTIFPILQGEANQRNIALRLSSQLQHACCVQANEVMLQRIVFNLVANAMDALDSLKESRLQEPCIHIELIPRQRKGQDWVVLQISDNGPGWPADMMQELTGPVVSSKAHGSGLGLLLTQSMVRLWGGHIALKNQPAEHGCGAVVKLWLVPVGRPEHIQA